MVRGESYEATLWQAGKQRCELWRAGEDAELRLFDGKALVYRESVCGRLVSEVAETLRVLTSELERPGRDES